MDLFASNIMWKKRSDGDGDGDDERCVHIKIVDWDASHCLEEGDFAPTVRVRLEQHIFDGYKKSDVVFGIPHDSMYLSVYEMPLEERHRTKWQGLASSGQKGVMDESFYTLLRDKMMMDRLV